VEFLRFLSQNSILTVIDYKVFVRCIVRHFPNTHRNHKVRLTNRTIVLLFANKKMLPVGCLSIDRSRIQSEGDFEIQSQSVLLFFCLVSWLISAEETAIVPRSAKRLSISIDGQFVVH